MVAKGANGHPGRQPLWDDGAVIRSEREGRALRGTVAYPVRTARLARPLGEDDVEDIVAYRSRSDVCRWVPFEPMSRNEVLDRIRSSLGQLTEEGRALTAGVELPAAEARDAVIDGQAHRRGIVIGDVVLIWRNREHATGEIGSSSIPTTAGRDLPPKPCARCLTSRSRPIACTGSPLG